ncbi:restriction endonuclease subunit S [Rhizobium laguerreae]|uniref:restriction endonuclease subunit S n=1 Tax=Rhizobium laguerreae TaxID=1076926 RepID=UPI001C905886|nr:restriction endonuclease subunit S [Rhizobium laguerreae]MBY3393569.1 restriction endonuclease subunit S [Rhizobium laguerreae]
MTAPWPLIELIEVCESVVDCVNKTAPLAGEVTPYKMLRTTNVRDGYVDTANCRFVTREVYEKWTRRQTPRRGDVILTREAPLGEVGMLRDDETVFLGQRLMSYRADPSKLDANFLLYSLLGPELQAQIRATGSGSTVEHMRVPDAERLRIPLPDISTQQRIGTILASYDELFLNNQRRIAILEDMARRLFDEWFARCRYPGHEAVPLVETELGMVPEGWAPTRLGSLLTLSYGKALKADQRRAGPVPVFGSSGMVGEHDQHLVQGPGIIVGRKGNVGSVHWSSQDFYPIDTVFFVETNIPLRWVYQLLKRQTFLNSDAAVPGLNREQAYAMKVVRPHAEPIGRYSQLVEPLFQQVELLTIQNTHLRTARDLLLPKLISGEIDVSTAEETFAQAAE